MRLGGSTLALAAIALLAGVLSVSGSLREALAGDVVLVSRAVVALVKTGVERVADLILAGILLDALSRWRGLDLAHASAAVVVMGPLTIAALVERSRGFSHRAEWWRLPGAAPAGIRWIAVLVLASLTAGCTLGPGTIARDRFDYSAAVADSWKSQMLLNLVRLRYGDTGVFLDVGQIVSGYTAETSVAAAASWSLFGFSIPHPNVPNNVVSAGVTGRFIDRPTITYTPIMGERFARSMMTPVPPASVFNLIQAGYPVDLVMRLMVSTVNGLDNRSGGDLRGRPAEPEFLELIERMRRVQQSGAIGMRVRRENQEMTTVLAFRQKVEPAIAADALAVRTLLGLDPSAADFRVVYGAIAANDREIAMLTRSALEILINLAAYIDVPDTHVAEHRVGPKIEPEQGPSGPLRPLLQVKSSREKPADTFVAVPYRDHWFWIDDRDIPSKRMFSFIMFIFTLVEPGTREAPPVLTIPTG